MLNPALEMCTSSGCPTFSETPLYTITNESAIPSVPACQCVCASLISAIFGLKMLIKFGYYMSHSVQILTGVFRSRRVKNSRVASDTAAKHRNHSQVYTVASFEETNYQQ